jgi:hypothetical protein
MKKNLQISIATLLLAATLIISCSKKEETAITSVIDRGYFGVGTVKHTVYSVSNTLAGDSTAYIIQAGAEIPNEQGFMYFKGFGSNGIGTQMTTGTYKVVYLCDTCKYILKPFDVLLTILTKEGGGKATSGTMDVVVDKGKLTATFSNITLDKTALLGFGKIILP